MNTVEKKKNRMRTICMRATFYQIQMQENMTIHRRVPMCLAQLALGALSIKCSAELNCVVLTCKVCCASLYRIALYYCAVLSEFAMAPFVFFFFCDLFFSFFQS